MEQIFRKIFEEERNSIDQLTFIKGISRLQVYEGEAAKRPSYRAAARPLLVMYRSSIV